jgi:hypothetical protein
MNQARKKLTFYMTPRHEAQIYAQTSWGYPRERNAPLHKKLWDFEGYAGILAAATTVESAY